MVVNTVTSVTEKSVSVPDEMLLQIFGYLEPHDLANCCQVNKLWSRVAADHNLWERFYRDISIDCDQNRPAPTDDRPRIISTIVEIPTTEMKENNYCLRLI